MKAHTVHSLVSAHAQNSKWILVKQPENLCTSWWMQSESAQVPSTTNDLGQDSEREFSHQVARSVAAT